MTDKEVEFMKYFQSKILPNRHKVDDNMIRTAAGFVGHPVNLTCPSCRHGAAMDLMNLYNRMLPAYDLWLKEQEKPVLVTKQHEVEAIPVVTTQYEAEVEKIEEPEMEDEDFFADVPAPTPKKKTVKKE